MDFDCISSFNREKPRQKEGKRLRTDYDIGNKILDRHQQIVRSKNRKARFILLEGNHEERIQRYIDENPQIEGYIEPEYALKLDERGIDYIKCYSGKDNGNTLKIGNAVFHHGLYANDHHAKKHVSIFGTNIFYGHVHDVQCYSMITKGNGKTIVGQSLGCLCEYAQSYIKGKPSRWQQAFAVFEFFPNGFFTYHVVRIFDHKFIFDGKIYDGTRG